MNDPHIDIDDLDENSATSGDKSAANDFQQPGRSSNFGEVFAGVSQMMRQWQDQMSNNFKLMPDEATKHFRASQREWLLGWRSLIDASLEKLERQDVRDELRKEANFSDSAAHGSTKIIVEEFDD